MGKVTAETWLVMAAVFVSGVLLGVAIAVLHSPDVVRLDTEKWSCSGTSDGRMLNCYYHE